MEVKQIISELEKQIARLKEARALLSGDGAVKRRGRPAGKPAAVSAAPRKHRLSAAGRKRISEALKQRWAARRKAAAKTTKAA